ncbi:hypothetical protein D3C75_701950 [compost metagenome]
MYGNFAEVSTAGVHGHLGHSRLAVIQMQVADLYVRAAVQNQHGLLAVEDKQRAVPFQRQLTLSL